LTAAETSIPLYFVSFVVALLKVVSNLPKAGFPYFLPDNQGYPSEFTFQNGLCWEISDNLPIYDWVERVIPRGSASNFVSKIE